MGDNNNESVTDIFKVIVLPKPNTVKLDDVVLLPPPPIGNNGPITECDIPETYFDLGIHQNTYNQELDNLVRDINDANLGITIDGIESELYWRPKEHITNHTPFDNPNVIMERVCYSNLPDGQNTQRTYYLSVDVDAQVNVVNPYNGSVMTTSITNNCDIDLYEQTIKKAPPLPASPNACVPVLTNHTLAYEMIDCEMVRTHVVCENDEFILGNPVIGETIAAAYDWSPKNSGLNNYSSANPVGTWAGMPINEDGGMVYKVDIFNDVDQTKLTRQCDFVWKCSSCGLGDQNNKTGKNHEHTEFNLPANSTLSINELQKLNTLVTVYSLSGKMLLKGLGKDLDFNVENYKDQLLIVRYSLNGSVYTKKLVIK